VRSYVPSIVNSIAPVSFFPISTEYVLLLLLFAVPVILNIPSVPTVPVNDAFCSTSLNLLSVAASNVYVLLTDVSGSFEASAVVVSVSLSASVLAASVPAVLVVSAAVVLVISAAVVLVASAAVVLVASAAVVLVVSAAVVLVASAAVVLVASAAVVLVVSAAVVLVASAAVVLVTSAAVVLVASAAVVLIVSAAVVLVVSAVVLSDGCEFSVPPILPPDEPLFPPSVLSFPVLPL
jgi:hypothetical protein